MEKIKWVANEMPKTDDKYLDLMSIETVDKVLAFHQSFPMYEETPLVELKEMAKYLGVGSFFVKDESYRFGLNAFKVLGGSLAIAKYIAEKLDMDITDLPYDKLISKEIKDKFGQATFFTATDGNHGRGVAWAANKLGQKSVVLMPKGTVPIRHENIKKEGAKVTIEEVNYDACVRMASEMAKEVENGVVVQDTAWEGYEKIPSWIMEGYGTMAFEASKQLKDGNVDRPTHVFVQAGVGSLPGAIAGYYANLYPDNPPIFVVIEADAADCHYKSAVEKDGEIRIVTGDLQTVMAGLACGEPNTISFDILKNHADFFVSMPDWVAKRGMRMLGAPLKGDPSVISGESGAPAMGLMDAIMNDDYYKDLKEAMKLDENSVVLMFSTEGDTDPDNYKKIVWR